MKTKPLIERTWWVWDNTGKKFVQKTLPAFEIVAPNYNTPRLRWYVTENPFSHGGNEYMVLEAGTGYVLSYGKNEEAAVIAGKRRFLAEVEGLNQSGCFLFIRGQQDLLRRFCGRLPGFTLPIPENPLKTLTPAS